MNSAKMWKYAINALRVAICFVVAWDMKDSPSAPTVVYLSFAIIGLMVTRRIYEGS
jgi:hypothetical protein